LPAAGVTVGSGIVASESEFAGAEADPDVVVVQPPLQPLYAGGKGVTAAGQPVALPHPLLRRPRFGPRQLLVHLHQSFSQPLEGVHSGFDGAGLGGLSLYQHRGGLPLQPASPYKLSPHPASRPTFMAGWDDPGLAVDNHPAVHFHHGLAVRPRQGSANLLAGCDLSFPRAETGSVSLAR